MSPSMANISQETLDDNTACVIFYRSSSLGGAIQAPIVEYIDEDVKFIGISSYNKKIRFITTPGEHIFVVGGESGSVLKADIAPKMNYYVRVSPYMGWAKARFDLKAVKFDELNDNKVKEKISKCVLVAPNDKAEIWFEKNKRSMKEKTVLGLEKFEGRKDKSQFILNQEDGIPSLY
ncbi:MAG: hypothetical protein J1E80_04825 [Desulfovibrionaceae bacterium]|nr:hypothetical protein [Desulfovibrionaceae bacterium]